MMINNELTSFLQNVNHQQIPKILSSTQEAPSLDNKTYSENDLASESIGFVDTINTKTNTEPLENGTLPP